MLRQYFSLRKRIYSEEIRHWLKQIEHLFVLIVAFLGTALPALFYFSLLAFGVILDNQSPSRELLTMVWSLLVTQSLVLMLCKQAILGNRYYYYLRSIEPNALRRWFADALFATLSSPFLILLLLIIGNIDIDDWWRLPHGFLLLGLLIGSMLSSVYRQNRLYWFLAGMLLCLPLLSTYSFVNALWVCAGLFALVQLIPSRFIPTLSILRDTLPSVFSVWIQACLGNQQIEGGKSASRSNGLVLVGASAMLLIVLTHYCAINLPAYANEVHFIGTSLLVLLCTSLQLSINKNIQRYSVFFRQFLWSRTFNFLQYWVSIGVLLIAICLASVVFSNWRVVTLLLSGLICLYFAKRKPNYFIAGWLLSVLSGAGLYFVL